MNRDERNRVSKLLADTQGYAAFYPPQQWFKAIDNAAKRTRKKSGEKRKRRKSPKI